VDVTNGRRAAGIFPKKRSARCRFNQATCGAQMGRSQSVVNGVTFALGIVITASIWRNRMWYLRDAKGV
jgi:hypothetical protein